MSALVIALALAAGNPSDAPVAPAQADDSGAAPRHAALAVEDCLALAAAGNDDAASRCYRRASARASPQDADTLLLLSQATTQLALDPPDLTAPVRRADPFGLGFDFGAFIASGKGELGAAATAAGAIGGTLLVYGGALIAPDASRAPAFGALLLLSPVIGGAVGLAGVGLLNVIFPGLTPGQAHVARAGITLGAFNALVVPLMVFAADPNPNEWVQKGIPIGAFMLLTSGAGLGALMAAARLPEETGPMALSGGLWASVVGATWFAATDPRGNDVAERLLRLVFVAGNGGFVLGGIGALVAPVSRAETWAIDLGGAVGCLGTLALATGLHAPNPAVGWGSVTAGTLAGMAGGLVLARVLPDRLAGLGAFPGIVAFGPAVAPNQRGGTDVVVTARISLW